MNGIEHERTWQAWLECGAGVDCTAVRWGSRRPEVHLDVSSKGSRWGPPGPSLQAIRGTIAGPRPDLQSVFPRHFETGARRLYSRIRRPPDHSPSRVASSDQKYMHTRRILQFAISTISRSARPINLFPRLTLAPRSHPQVRLNSTPASGNKMASDDAYEAFLDKANNQSSSSAKTADSGSAENGFKTLKTSDASVPRALSQVGEQYFVSDADYPFEAVSYSFSGSLSKGTVTQVSEYKSKQPLTKFFK